MPAFSFPRYCLHYSGRSQRLHHCLCLLSGSFLFNFDQQLVGQRITASVSYPVPSPV